MLSTSCSHRGAEVAMAYCQCVIVIRHMALSDDARALHYVGWQLVDRHRVDLEILDILKRKKQKSAFNFEYQLAVFDDFLHFEHRSVRIFSLRRKLESHGSAVDEINGEPARRFHMAFQDMNDSIHVFRQKRG